MDKDKLLEFIDLDDIDITFEHFDEVFFDFNKHDYDLTKDEKRLYELLDEIDDILHCTGEFDSKFLKNEDWEKLDDVIGDYHIKVRTTYINDHFGELFKILYGEDYINQCVYFRKYLVKDEKENNDE